MSAIVKAINSELDQPNLNDSEKKLFLTEKQIRASAQFKNASEEEVVNIINSLHQLALITYELISAELDDKMESRQAA